MSAPQVKPLLRRSGLVGANHLGLGIGEPIHIGAGPGFAAGTGAEQPHFCLRDLLKDFCRLCCSWASVMVALGVALRLETPWDSAAHQRLGAL